MQQTHERENASEPAYLYDRDGYLLVKSALPAELLQQLRAETDLILCDAKNLTGETERFSLESTHSPERPRVQRIKSPHAFYPFFQQLAAHPAIIRHLVPLLGPNIRLHGSKLNMKAAGDGAPVEWHQDWAFYPHSNDDVLAVGIFLDDSTPENGPLQFIPGSHKGPTFDHHNDGAFVGAVNLDISALPVNSAVSITGPAGSISIHHARLLHGSAPNRSAYDRRLLLFEYTAADAWPLMGMRGDLDAFNARIVAGKPTLSPRLRDAPVRMPLPPAPNQGSIYANQKGAGRRYFKETGG